MDRINVQITDYSICMIGVMPPMRKTIWKNHYRCPATNILIKNLALIKTF